MSCMATDASTIAHTLNLHELRAAIEHVAHLLPSQGPITAFVHHNTLHAFEDLPFDEAVIQGSRVFGCQPYLSEEHYRELLEAGRIRREDLRYALMEDLGDTADVLVASFGTRFHLRLVMLDHSLRMASSTEVRWLMAETDAMRRFQRAVPHATRDRVISETRRWVMCHLAGRREQAGSDHALQRLTGLMSELYSRTGDSAVRNLDQAGWEALTLRLLWRLCHQGVHGLPEPSHSPTSLVRHRDVLHEATSEDTDLLVHDILIRFCAAFVDQGFGTWRLPHRGNGFLAAFSALYGHSAWPFQTWLRDLPHELQHLHENQISPLESIARSLAILGVSSHELEDFLLSTSLALRGWAGMIWQLESNAEWTSNPAPSGSLVEFLAVRLILERLALAYVAKKKLAHAGPLSELRSVAHRALKKHESVSVDQRAFLVFQLAQFLGWEPEDLFGLRKDQWNAVVREVEAFGRLQRRKIYHLAYERRYTTQALDAFSNHRPRSATEQPIPSFQIVCCIDDREESFRRHLEEIEPNCQTFGAAGFFAVVMYYRGAADAHYQPLCPVVVKPQHYVREDALYTAARVHRRRSETRKALGATTHRWHLGSRTFLGGILTALVGTLAVVPMVARILFPRLTAQVRRVFARIVEPPATQLLLTRSQPNPGPENGQLGFTLQEMAGIVERLLRDIGLTAHFAPLVIIAGHGSSSLNNPHESAYNCGACSGGRGGPNARAFAQMANDPRVRLTLQANGLHIPEETWFVGAYHNTCDDHVSYFDLDRLPIPARTCFENAMKAIDVARQRNAHERCRRFESALLSQSPEEALRHVQARSEDLSQARPEYNHATNSMCIVGRRQRSRGLFLDRRAFLTSYDPTQDNAQGDILARILGAVIPVCSGISLEYYFSCVDPAGFGCGSKLPHNITSLLGVMEGAASDLRTGLSQQMTEIHEPLRILFVIETTPPIMQGIMSRNPVIGRLVRNAWIQLAILDPQSSGLQVYNRGQFLPYEPQSTNLPLTKRSIDWYRGWRDNLGFAAISGEQMGEETSGEVRE